MVAGQNRCNFSGKCAVVLYMDGVCLRSGPSILGGGVYPSLDRIASFGVSGLLYPSNKETGFESSDNHEFDAYLQDLIQEAHPETTLYLTSHGGIGDTIASAKRLQMAHVREAGSEKHSSQNASQTQETCSATVYEVSQEEQYCDTLAADLFASIMQYTGLSEPPPQDKPHPLYETVIVHLSPSDVNCGSEAQWGAAGVARTANGIAARLQQVEKQVYVAVVASYSQDGATTTESSSCSSCGGFDPSCQRVSITPAAHVLPDRSVTPLSPVAPSVTVPVGPLVNACSSSSTAAAVASIAAFRPHQSCAFTAGVFLSEDYVPRFPLLVSHYHPDTTRRDGVTDFTESSIWRQGANGKTLASRLLVELRFKLGRSPKYGA